MKLSPSIIDHFNKFVKRSNPPIYSYNDIFYQYRTVSTAHFLELRRYMAEIRKAGLMGDHPTFEYYMQSRTFDLLEDFPEAKSVIILAYFRPHAKVAVRFHGLEIPTYIPSPYYDEVEDEEYLALIRCQILPETGFRVQLTHTLPSKTLAAHSGLVQYGRNNITYTAHFGSCLTLRTFFTDYEFPRDDWGEIQMLSACNGCSICENLCPNQCISRDQFVIDVNRCLPLYNEIQGEIPDFMPPTAHHTLIGCLQCQKYCPANREIQHFTNTIAPLTEDETQAILSGTVSPLSRAVVCDKLKIGTIAGYERMLVTLQRNLALLVRNN